MDSLTLRPPPSWDAGTGSVMVAVPSGTLRMGSDEFYPEEGPVHPRRVAAFLIDRSPVTNRRFAAFVAATGHITTAEQELDPGTYPLLDEHRRRPGSKVFHPTRGPVDVGDWRHWWAWVPGADWRHPGGPDTTTEDRLDHPVVHVSVADAEAYAAWAGKRLPTEAEFEWAAKGGGPETTYAWGPERDLAGRVMANTWRGVFPYRNTGSDGWVGTSPVGAFPANGYGLSDLIGNVWEWTASPWTSTHLDAAAEIEDPDGPARASWEISMRRTSDDAQPASGVARRVLKGGSHLCAPEYCLRYRPAARLGQAEDSPTSHIGFRCAI